MQPSNLNRTNQIDCVWLIK